MDVIWNPWAAPFLFLSVVEAGLGVLVFAARPDRLQNRILAITLVGEGIAWAFVALRFSTSDPRVFYAAWTATQVGWVITLSAYLAFLGTLETPLSRPLRSPRARWTLVAMFPFAVATFVMWRDSFVSTLGPGSIGPLEADLSVVGNAWWFLTLAIAVFGFFVALSMYRRAPPGSVKRSQAAAYLAAFAVRDLAYAATVAIGFAASGAVIGRTGWVIHWFAYTAFAVLLAYGILRYQLFAIDLRIKWTLRQSTVAAVFVAVFFLVSEGAAQFLGDQTGSAYWGIGATTLLVFLMAPLQRIARRLADRAMPDVEDTDTYRRVRKREVYQAAVESALEDETITDRERSVLATVGTELGLSPTEALEIERQAVQVARRRGPSRDRSPAA